MSQRRIIVTGHSGIHKTAAIKRLERYIYHKDNLWKELKGNPQFEKERLKREKELVEWVEAEADLKAKTAIFRGNFLYTHDPKTRFDEWFTSLSNAVSKLEGSTAESKFLILNASFYSQSQFFSPLFWSFGTRRDPWKILGKYGPTQLINLYDNIYFAREQIKEPYHFSPSELLHWRNIELFITDLLANRLIPWKKRNRRREIKSADGRYPFERSMHFAVGHPVQSLYKLLFDEQCYRVYLSFQISEPRRKFESPASSSLGRKLMNQIDEFRKEMGKYFVTFDPLTIDELPLKFAYKNAGSRQKIITLDTSIHARKVWPTIYEEALCGERLEKKLDFPRSELETISLDKPRTRDVKGDVSKASELDDHVASRDFRLIDQVAQPPFCEPRLQELTNKESYRKFT